MDRSIIPLFLVMPVLLQAQVTTTALDLSGTAFVARSISAPSPDVVFVGLGHPSNAMSVRDYARTTDGGATWTLGSIPDAEDRGIMSMHALDANTAWASLSNNSGGALYRTTDGGATWSQLTTTEFVGGWLNLAHFTDLDNGVAVGDPRDGYFEIHTTNDGGISWERVPAEDIPEPLAGEYGIADAYHAIDDRLWVATNKGRLMMSADLGRTWTLCPIPAGPPSTPDVSFNDAMHGVSHPPLSFYPVSLTADGGLTWTTHAPQPSVNISRIAAVQGVPGAFVFTVQGPVRLMATTDNFQTYALLDDTRPYSYGLFKFADASRGWIPSGISASDSAMYRIDLMGSGVDALEGGMAQMHVFPNPVPSGNALVVLEMDESEGGLLHLHDAAGRIVRTWSVPALTGRHAQLLDMSGLTAGAYLLELRANVTRAVTRVVLGG